MPIVKKRKSENGKTGAAQIKFSRDDVVVKFEEDKTVENLPAENVPDFLIGKDGRFIVTLDKENTRIKYASVPRGVYLAKFTGFSHKEGEQPMYRTVEFSPKTAWRDFPIPRHLEFTALFEVIDNPKDEYNGFPIPLNLWYIFYDYDGTGTTTAFGGQGETRLGDFLLATGIDMVTDSIPYSDNVLPALEKMLLEKGKTVAMVINDKGFVKSIEPG